MNRQDFDSWLADPCRRPLIMGVLNVTPDSFSDGGRFFDARAALDRAREMIRQGAAVIDVGGESTRPGAEPVPTAVQIERVVPVVRAMRELDVVVSVDTTDADVAEAALDVGATLLNDISAGRLDDRMLPLAAGRGVPIALMHMQGTPRTMQADPTYADVVAEVRSFLADRARAAESAGVARHRILVDVGIGFGKTLAHNLSLLRHHASIAALGYATLIGASRKGFIGKITGVEAPEARIHGTAATVAWAVANGGHLVRVHDVEAIRQTLAMTDAILRAD